MRYILSIILCLYTSCAWSFTPGFIGAVCVGGGISCNLTTPSHTQNTSTLGYAVGSTDAFRYVGIVNTGASSIILCGINLYLRENGSLTGKNIYIERWSMSGNNIDIKLEDVANFDATLAPAVIDFLASPISFGKTVTLSQNQALVITFNETTGATNNLTWAFQADSNPVAFQSFGSWTNLKVGTVDSTDDARVKLYGP